MSEYKTKGLAVIYRTTLADIVGIGEEDRDFIEMKYIGLTIRDKENYLSSGKRFNRDRRYLQTKYGRDKVIYEKVIIKVYPGSNEDSDAQKRIWLNEEEKKQIELVDAVNNERYFNDIEGGYAVGLGFGENHPMYGTHHSEEAKKKISEANTGEKNPMYGRTGEKHPMFGRTGEKNPMFGTHPSEETIKKMTEINRHVMKPVEVNGVVYESLRGAARVLNIDRQTLRDRFNSKSEKFKDWNYVDKNETRTFQSVSEEGEM